MLEELAAFAGGDARDDLRAVVEREAGMAGAEVAGDALDEDLGFGRDEDGHGRWDFEISYAATSLTIFWAASAMESPLTIVRPLFASVALPATPLFPSRRTTSGSRSPTSRAASTIPLAITSQSMMPPKMLTRIPFTFGSPRMILKAATTCSLVAPPPTSRKFAGFPPKYLMMSIVLIASPAPFTRQAMFPSSAM